MSKVLKDEDFKRKFPIKLVKCNNEWAILIVIHQCYTLMNPKRLLSKILINLMISIELYLQLR